MRQSMAVNLVILGGGLTLFGAATTLSQQNKAQAACQRARAEGIGNSDPSCQSSSHGGFFHGGYGGRGSRGSFFAGGFFSPSHGSVTRGGFGGFGRGFSGGG